MGGIEYIATAMRSHPTGSELQFSACRALAKLSRHADNLVKIDAAGGIECIATSMRSHPTDGKFAPAQGGALTAPCESCGAGKYSAALQGRQAVKSS